MSRFIVHFGAHKTGTTAFQFFLQENRDALRQVGLFLPELGKQQAGNYRGLARAMGGEFEQHPARQDRLMEPLQPVLQPEFNEDVLISSEYLSTNNFRPYLCDFAKYIDSLGFRKIAILVIRDQIGWFNSRMSQKRKMLHETTHSFQQRVEEMMEKNEGCWISLIHQLEDFGFDVFTLAYNKPFLEQGVVSSLFRTNALSRYGADIKFIEPSHHNATFGAKHQILADLIRDYVTSQLGISTHKIDRNAMRVIMTEEFDGKNITDVAFNGFSPEFQKHVKRHYRRGNEKVAATYFKTDWEEIFPESVLPEVSPESIADLSHEEQRLLKDIALKVVERASRQGVFPIVG